MRQAAAVAMVAGGWLAAALWAEDGRFPALSGQTFLYALLLPVALAVLALLVGRRGTRAGLLWFSLGAALVGGLLLLFLYGLVLVAFASAMAALVWPRAARGYVPFSALSER